MKISVQSDAGDDFEFEAADNLASVWVCREILRGRTYRYLPFIDDVRVVFDIGANCGAVSVYFARRYPDAQVHAFEPGSTPLALLERNLAPIANATAHPFGLFSDDREVKLYQGHEDSITGSVFRRSVNSDEYETVTLRAAGPWARAAGIDRIDILKIDVEGCEVDVLESLRDYLPTVKVCYVEYDSRAARRRIRDLLEDTHDLFTAIPFLDQGEATYVRKDLAASPAATAFVRALAEASTEKSEAIRLGQRYPQLRFVDDVRSVVDIGAGTGAASVCLATRYPDAHVRAITFDDERDLDRNLDGLTNVRVERLSRDAPEALANVTLDPVDVLKIDVPRREREVFDVVRPVAAASKILYVEFTERASASHIDHALDETHNLFAGSMLLDEGYLIYVQHAYSDHEDAQQQLRDIFDLWFHFGDDS